MFQKSGYCSKSGKNAEQLKSFKIIGLACIVTSLLCSSVFRVSEKKLQKTIIQCITKHLFLIKNFPIYIYLLSNIVTLYIYIALTAYFYWVLYCSKPLEQYASFLEHWNFMPPPCLLPVRSKKLSSRKDCPKIIEENPPRTHLTQLPVRDKKLSSIPQKCGK